MPLWIIYHPPTTFQDEETKASLAKDITSSISPYSSHFIRFPVYSPSIDYPKLLSPFTLPTPTLTPPVYTSVSLPAFYVNVLYIPIPPSSLFIGGVARPSALTSSTPKGPDPRKPWIRVTIQNIARKIPNKEVADQFLERVDKALEPWIQDMGEWIHSVTVFDCVIC
jgi:hypothetical protein